MMENIKLIFKAFIFLVLPIVLKAQEINNDTLKTEKLTITKSYRPSLKENSKILEIPKIVDSTFKKKIEIQYTFKSVPVVSTFSPNKATPLKLRRQESIPYHNSYFAAGYGSKSQTLVNLASMTSINRYNSFGVDFLNTSLEPIEGTSLNSDQNRILFSLLHQFKTRTFRIDSDIRYDLQKHNFYGLKNINWANVPSFRKNLIDPEQKLKYLSIGSRLQWYDKSLSKININAHYTSDSFDTYEYLIFLNSLLNFSLFGQSFELIPKFELMNSKFNSGYFDQNKLSFSNYLSSMSFQFLKIEKEINLKIGFIGFYENLGKNFNIYPDLKVYFNLESKKVVPFIEYGGKYDLNTFTSFSLENPYVSPTLNLRSTITNHDLNVGVQIYLSSTFSMKYFAHYGHFDNHPFFKRLPYDINNQDIAYRLGNSYEVVYDKLVKTGLISSFNFNFNEHNKLSFGASYFYLERSDNQTIWNIPSFSMDLDGNFKIGKKIFFQISSEFLGKRDTLNYIMTGNDISQNELFQIESLKPLLRVSSILNWKISSSWDLFYENNFHLGGVSSRWANYQNQTQIHLGGIRYKFDLKL